MLADCSFCSMGDLVLCWVFRWHPSVSLSEVASRAGAGLGEPDSTEPLPHPYCLPYLVAMVSQEEGDLQLVFLQEPALLLWVNFSPCEAELHRSHQHGICSQTELAGVSVSHICPCSTKNNRVFEFHIPLHFSKYPQVCWMNRRRLWIKHWRPLSLSSLIYQIAVKIL